MSLSLIKHQRPDIDKIYLHVKNLFRSKYQLLINGKVKVEVKKSQNHSLIVQKELMMSMKIWKNIIQKRREKC